MYAWIPDSWEIIWNKCDFILFFFSTFNLPLAVESGSRKMKNSRNPDESLFRQMDGNSLLCCVDTRFVKDSCICGFMFLCSGDQLLPRPGILLELSDVASFHCPAFNRCKTTLQTWNNCLDTTSSIIYFVHSMNEIILTPLTAWGARAEALGIFFWPMVTF